MIRHPVAPQPKPASSLTATDGTLRVESREQLVYLLTQAAELEHGLMCEYLFAQWTLKRSTSEGVTEAQLAKMASWEDAITGVAMEEMLHLALATNMLTALGAAPHFDRPNFPILSGWYPPGVQIALVPFGERALRHFVYLERPEGMSMEDAEGFKALDEAEPLTDGRLLMAVQQDYATVSGLYRGIQDGFHDLVARHGADEVFIGPPEAQAKEEAFRWPAIIDVTDLDTVDRAIEAIIEHGEGARGAWRDAHFGIFLRVLEEYRAERAADPTFQPARDVVPAYVHDVDDADAPVATITDPRTAQVADLFDAIYATTLMALTRYFVHSDETLEQVAALARTARRLMAKALRPTGIAMTALPVAAEDGPRAGPSFRMVPTTFYTLPHKKAAWHVLQLRVRRMRDRARELASDPALASLGPVADKLEEVLADLQSASGGAVPPGADVSRATPG